MIIFILHITNIQNNDDGNVNKDMYIPNPACGDLAKYEWIGQLMGACFRGKEILVRV